MAFLQRTQARFLGPIQHNYLLPPVADDQHPLLASTGVGHKSGTLTHMQVKHICTLFNKSVLVQGYSAGTEQLPNIPETSLWFSRQHQNI